MDDMRTSRLTATALTALLLAAALSGCTATIVDGSAQSSEKPTTEQTTEQTSTPDRTEADTEEPATTDDADESTTSGLSPQNAAERERLTAEATTVMPCPSGPLDQDGAVIRVEGSCAELVIDIDAGVVIADDVTTLTLSGSGTVVFAENIDALTVTGSASIVYWTGSTPTVDDSGTANTLTRG
jgi:hypothetical protein